MSVALPFCFWIACRFICNVLSASWVPVVVFRFPSSLICGIAVWNTDQFVLALSTFVVSSLVLFGIRLPELFLNVSTLKA